MLLESVVTVLPSYESSGSLRQLLSQCDRSILEAYLIHSADLKDWTGEQI